MTSMMVKRMIDLFGDDQYDGQENGDDQYDGQ